MQIDLKTQTIKPLRNTYVHVAKYVGDKKPATRYQEGTYGLQPDANFHYRPTWAPEFEIFDKKRTKIEMENWYSLKDPRQFYYGSYCSTRGRMQETAEGDFAFVESRGLTDSMPEAPKKMAIETYVPLRHVAWGANMNNTGICAYGWGTIVTAPAIFHAMDNLGIAQYLSRLGLALGEVEALNTAKRLWMEDEKWQGMRRLTEDLLVIQDWFELYVAQNLAFDGILYPLVYEKIDRRIQLHAGPTVAMLTRFQSEWFAETSKWVNAVIKGVASESEANMSLVRDWTDRYKVRAIDAVTPLAQYALGDDADSAMDDVVNTFNERVAKIGVK